MEESTARTFSTTPDASDTATRVRQIRARLPGQVLRERLDIARALYGELSSRTDVQNKIANSLPYRLGYRRIATLTPIETYREAIPDDALLKYDDAVRSDLFGQFLVATVRYRDECDLDPWIVGEVKDSGLFAVIAQWDMAAV